jgi:hypothetical protein
MHIYRSRFLTRGEVWYDHDPDQTPVDWILYRQRTAPVAGTKWKFFHTILLDLGQSPEVLLQQMGKTTAYKIRRARDRDRIACECFNPVSHEMLDRFQETYRRFTAIKGLSPLDRPFLDRLAQDGFLELSVAKDPGGKPLAYHAYYLDSNRSCLLHTVSLYQMLSDSAARNAMGRANRYLFWWDMLRHQEQGLKFFDFGGWYPGNTNQDLLDINRFKEGFGGKIVREYNCEQILTFKGRVLLGTASLLNRIRSLSVRRRSDRTLRQQGSDVTLASARSPEPSAVAEVHALPEPET